MKGSEIEIGKRYLAKVSGKVVSVVVRGVRERFSFDGRKSLGSMWDCQNTVTGRAVVVRSAQRFRAAVHA